MPNRQAARRALPATAPQDHSPRIGLEERRVLARRVTDVEEATLRRVSAEMHDRIGSTMYALAISLGILGQLIPHERRGRVAHRLRECEVLLGTAMKSVRDLISDLRPPVLQQRGLLPALRWLAQQHRKRAALRIDVTGQEPKPRLEPSTELALFRIAQEALANALKHGRARVASLSLHRRAGKVVLVIADDGIGFDPQASPPGGPYQHWGLLIMEERAEAVGGRFFVESARSRGTRVTVEVNHP